jgi:hypothetical protein
MNKEKEELKTAWIDCLHRIQEFTGSRALPADHDLGHSTLIAVTDARHIFQRGLSCCCNERERLFWLEDAVGAALHRSVHVAIPCSLGSPSSSPTAATAALSRAHVHEISFETVQKCILLYWEVLEPCICSWLASPATSLAQSTDLVLHICYASLTRQSATPSTHDEEALHAHISASATPPESVPPQATQAALQALQRLVDSNACSPSAAFTSHHPSRLQQLLQAPWLSRSDHACGVATLRIAFTCAARHELASAAPAADAAHTCASGHQEVSLASIADAALAELADVIVLHVNGGHKEALAFVMGASSHIAMLALKHTRAAQAAELLLGAAALDCSPGGAVTLVAGICHAAAVFAEETKSAPTGGQSCFARGLANCTDTGVLQHRAPDEGPRDRENKSPNRHRCVTT